MKIGDLKRLLDRITTVTVAVLGDFCLDRYLEIDPSIRDFSVETGLPIHQVVRVRSSGGGGGNVLANLAALRPASVLPVGFIGADGEGFELKKSLRDTSVSFEFVEELEDRPTPAYIKPLFREGNRWKEGSRFDIFPRSPLPEDLQEALLERLDRALERADALVVSDYWEKGKEGVVTPKVRERVNETAASGRLPVIVDSRRFADRFRNVFSKPNENEAAAFLGLSGTSGLPLDELARAGRSIARRNSRPVFLTMGERGMLVCREDRWTHIPAFPVEGEVDIVGAGDSVLASVSCALAAGAFPEAAGLMGTLAASVTVQQVGTTGTASPEALLERFEEYSARFPDTAESIG